MHVTVQPPLSAWQPCSGPPPDMGALTVAANEHARQLSTTPVEPTGPVMTTGHQPWLWHPGILAKFLAAAAQAKRLGGQALHLVVDHDVHPALELEIPRREGERLGVQRVVLARQLPAVPVACQGPADTRRVQQSLAELRGTLDPVVAAGLRRLSDAFTDLPACRTLAQQLAVVLFRLMRPLTGPLPLLFATDLAQMTSFQGVVDRMRAEAPVCALAYNQAVEQFPAAGIAPLAIDADRVELPLWSLAWQQPRRRVFATRTHPLRLVLENGDPADPACLAPRALMLTAFLRQRLCNFFIHGRGGGVYEQVGETWWSRWLGGPLAPMAVVSADVYLELGAPVADVAELRRAQWLVHHLPHNVDRVLALDGPAVQHKRALLAKMDADRDRARRAQAFRTIHRINTQLAGEHADAIERARQELARARTGIANRAIAAKRDWCFALYGRRQLDELARSLGL